MRLCALRGPTSAPRSPCRRAPAARPTLRPPAVAVQAEGAGGRTEGGPDVRPQKALNAPEGGEEDGVTRLKFGEKVQLAAMGPVIVNSDGTLRRIDNWDAMTPGEQEATMRRIGKRNQERLARLREEGVEVKGLTNTNPDDPTKAELR
mmetsp:Transcript_50896/g.162907  ORF Transcript_50896/g.162907 Transcript_50896/m.162907 type:complete len:148 (-) Transcript_50896:86-529(-)